MTPAISAASQDWLDKAAPQCLINNTWVSASGDFATCDPATGATLGHIAEAGPAISMRRSPPRKPRSQAMSGGA